MPSISKHSRLTVRRRLFGTSPTLLCLLVFGLTAIIVYRWGRQSWIPVNPKATYAATACVVQEPHNAAAGGRVPIEYVGDSAERAAEVAIAQAQRYVHDRLAEWKLRTQRPYLKARAAAEKARQEHVENTARLEAFRRQLAEAAEAARAKAAAKAPEKPPPPMVDNPQWLDLERQLAELQRRCDDLLLDRTPQHPLVVDLTGRMAIIQEKLTATPRLIPSGNTESPVPADTSPAAETPTADAEGGDQDGDRIAKENQARLDELTAAVERTRQAREQAELAEKRALQTLQAGPNYAIEPAQVVEQLPQPDYGWRRLAWTTLFSGVLMALGVGAVAAGANVEPPVASVAELKADLDVPIVGPIPADDPVADPAAVSRRRSSVRRTMIGIGLALIAACPVVAIWGVIGI
jgi:hypothetical protein